MAYETDRRKHFLFVSKAIVKEQKYEQTDKHFR